MQPGISSGLRGRQTSNSRVAWLALGLFASVATVGTAAWAAGEASAAVESAAGSHDDAEHTLHTHEPLDVSASLSIADALDQALARYPTQAELEARMRESRALAGAAASWLPEAPIIYASHLNDAPLDDLGQRELDAGIELPLWRLGQKSAARAVGAAAGVEADAAGAALRWELAGALRDVLWKIQVADNALGLAREAEALAARLNEVVERRVAAGDLAAADALLARSALLDRELERIDREAGLLDAERAYRSLTGLDTRPAEIDEPRAPRDDFDDGHPALALVDAEIARARARRELVAETSRGTPWLVVGPHRQRDPLGTFFSSSLVVEYRRPVGGNRYGAPARAAADREVAAAEARRGLRLRELDLALHEAEHELSVIDQAAGIRKDRADLYERQLDMGLTAFDLGEIDLRDLLRIQAAAIAARRDLAESGIARNRTIAMMNQALGELPQ